MDELFLFAQQLALDILGCVFLVAGGAKLLSISHFREGLLYLPHMRPAFTYVVGFALPPLELLTALGLFANSAWARISALALLGCFFGVTLMVLRKKLLIECHCFGGWETRAFSRETLGEIALLMALAITSFNLSERSPLVLGISTGAFLLIGSGVVAHAIKNARLIAQLKQRGVV
ncbi:MAG: hypothetical protein HYS12_18800 [Planctomycetes bacterium]|nr:hypothetical protein [Planctomycetota bacterium]